MPTELRTRAGLGTAQSAFDDLRAQLAVATATSGDGDSLAQTGRLLADAFADPRNGAAILGSWADAIDAGVELDRGRSQMHNNGFSKISLARFGAWNLRLHVWPAGRGDARIHDHRWSFASIAVDGALDVMNYTPDHDATGEGRHTYRLYDATGAGEKRLERVEDAVLRPTSAYRIAAGAFHVLDYRDPHVVWNTTSSDAVTLMLSGPARREYSHSYGARDVTEILPAPAVVDDGSATTQVRALAARLDGRAS